MRARLLEVSTSKSTIYPYVPTGVDLLEWYSLIESKLVAYARNTGRTNVDIEILTLNGTGCVINDDYLPKDFRLWDLVTKVKIGNLPSNKQKKAQTEKLQMLKSSFIHLVKYWSDNSDVTIAFSEINLGKWILCFSWE